MNEILVYNQTGDSISYLTQWDENVSIFIKEQGIATNYNVHFFNTNSQESMTMKSKFVNGSLEVVVPNLLLTEAFTITGYIYKVEGNSGRSIYCFKLPVRKRAKPEGYIYTESPDYLSVDKILTECRIYADSAKLSETNAKASETKVGQDKAVVEQIKTDVTQTKTDVASMKDAVSKDKTAVANDKVAITTMKETVTQDKTAVANMKSDVSKEKAKIDAAMADFTTSSNKAKTDAINAINSAGTTQTKAVNDAGVTQVQSVTAEGTKQVQAVTAEGTKQLDAVKTAAQGVVADRQQIQTNKTEIGNLKQSLNDTNILRTVSGETVVCENSAEDSFQGLKVFGKSEQDGAPSLEVPSPIKTVGDKGSVEVDISGKNLFPNLPTLFSSGLNASINNDGSITVYGKATRTWANITNIDFICPFKVSEYIFSIEEPCDCAIIGIKHKKQGTIEGQIISRISIGQKEIKYTISDESNDCLSIFIEGLVAEKKYNFTFKPMLRYTDMDSGYEQYKQPQSIILTTPNGLAGIKVTANGNYTDSKGQQWICDEINNKEYIQRVGRIESYSNEPIDAEYLSSTGKLSVGASVIYVLKEPIVTPLSSEESQAFKQLHTNNPTTIITTDENAPVEVTYTADTNIQRYVSGKDKAIDVEIGNLKQALNDTNTRLNDVDQALNTTDKKIQSLTNSVNGYTDTYFKNFFAMQRTGKKYTVKFPLWETSQVSTGEKLDDNKGLIVEASTITEKGRDDYENIPLFRTYDCNVEKVNGKLQITAMKGDVNYDPYEKDTFVLGMPYYHKAWIEGGYLYYSRSDTQHTGYTICKEAEKTGGIRGFCLYAKYMAGRNSNGLLGSYKDKAPVRSLLSHNTNIAEGKKRGDEYCFGSSYDVSYIQTTFLLKYADKNWNNKLGGDFAYNMQYQVSKAETNTKRVVLAKANAERLIVGSAVSVGDLGVDTNKDRGNAKIHNICDNVEIIDIVEVDVNNKAIVLNIPNNITTTATTWVTTMHWHSGFSENVKGRDGCACQTKSQITSLYYPSVIQGIECMVGGYETLGNVFMDIVDGTHRDVYICDDVAKLTTNVTTAKTTYKKLAKQMIVPKNNQWNYNTEMEFDLTNGINYMTRCGDSGSGSSTGYCDGTYFDAATSGQREFLCFGDLGAGVVYGAFCVYGSPGVGNTWWAFLARLSLNLYRGDIS